MIAEIYKGTGFKYKTKYKTKDNKIYNINK